MGEPAKGGGAIAAIVLAIVAGGVVGVLLISPPWGDVSSGADDHHRRRVRKIRYEIAALPMTAAESIKELTFDPLLVPALVYVVGAPRQAVRPFRLQRGGTVAMEVLMLVEFDDQSLELDMHPTTETRCGVGDSGVLHSLFACLNRQHRAPR
jgi:hypothetical protein